MEINYLASFIFIMLGLYVTVFSKNLFKKLAGLSVFQSSVLLPYISSAYYPGAVPPVIQSGQDYMYANPVPHVLMLTAIVVGVSTFALGLILIVRIKEQYNTTEITPND